MRGGGVEGEKRREEDGRELCEKGDVGPEVGWAPQNVSARLTLSPLTHKKVSTLPGKAWSIVCSRELFGTRFY